MQDDLAMLIDNFPEVAAEEELFFATGGLQIKLIRKLRRGQLPIEACLDLHGLILPEAKQALIDFLNECLTNNMRHVIIVHGKGMHSAEQKATLKSALNSWLRQIAEVLAFCSAKPQDGGRGAVYVLLKRYRK